MNNDTSSSNAPIPFRLRKDLRIKQIQYQCEPYWVVKDPHAQKLYRFNEQEFAVLSWLDGTNSYEDVRDRFHENFTPYRITFKEVTTLLRSFFEKSLVIPTRSQVGLRLHQMGLEKRRKELVQKLKSILALKWKGWNPETFINTTAPYTSWFFSKQVVVCVMLFVVASLAWLGLHLEEFYNRAPTLSSFFHVDNWLSLGIAVTLTKLLHELGHAYANYRAGGECHEIGVMIFFFMPTLYCNTTDSHLMPDKWRRLSVGLGGVYVELFICALAIFGWWFSAPGPFQDLCLNVALICSVSSVIMNGNPFLKYDGYYVLSDFLEIPNLDRQANEEVRRSFLYHVCGIDHELDLISSRYNRRIFFGYALIAFICRLALIVGVAYFLIERFRYIGLQNFALAMTVVSVVGVIAKPFKSLYDHFKIPGNISKMNAKRLRRTIIIVLLILASVSFYPLPYHITAECSVQLADGSVVYVEEKGWLVKTYVQPGDEVQKGQAIAQLENRELENSLIEQKSLLATTLTKIQQRELIDRQTLGTSASSDQQSLTRLQATKHRLEKEIELMSRRQDALLVRANRAGRIYGEVLRPRVAESDDRNLNRLHGSPLAHSNLGGSMEVGDVVCRIGASNQYELHLTIEQKFNGLVRPGQSVTLLLDSHNRRLRGQVESVSSAGQPLGELPRSIWENSSSVPVARAKQVANEEGKKDRTYKDGQTFVAHLTQGKVKLNEQDQLLLNWGSTGHARIRVGNRSLWWRLKRSVSEFFQHNG